MFYLRTEFFKSLFETGTIQSGSWIDLVDISDEQIECYCYFT
jgi:hypothetical protein